MKEYRVLEFYKQLPVIVRVPGVGVIMVAFTLTILGHRVVIIHAVSVRTAGVVWVILAAMDLRVFVM